MRKSRRLFFKKGLAGAVLLATASTAQAEASDPVEAKVTQVINPFHLGMAGYTFLKFDLETTVTLAYN